MFQKVDFRDVCDDHFVVVLNDENTYFVAIPMAIMCQVAFCESITPRLWDQISQSIKDFSKKWICDSTLMCLESRFADLLFR